MNLSAISVGSAISEYTPVIDLFIVGIFTTLGHAHTFHQIFPAILRAHNVCRASLEHRYVCKYRSEDDLAEDELC